MKKSSEPVPTPNPEKQEGVELPDLEFPVAPDFLSRPPRLDPQVILRRSAEAMPARNARPARASAASPRRLTWSSFYRAHAPGTLMPEALLDC